MPSAKTIIKGFKHCISRTRQKTRFESVLSQSLGYSYNEALLLVKVAELRSRKYVTQIKR